MSWGEGVRGRARSKELGKGVPAVDAGTVAWPCCPAQGLLALRAAYSTVIIQKDLLKRSSERMLVPS